MDLPLDIKNYLEELLSGYKLSTLKEASFSIVNEYLKDNKSSSIIDDDLKAKVYAVTRMPATFKAASEVLENTFKIYDPNISSALDIGAGLGAASLALNEHKEVDHIDLYEKESAMRRLGSSIYKEYPFSYKEFDITKDEIVDKYDLVIASYMFNEIDSSLYKECINKMYKATNDLVVVIEPGTPKGYSIIQTIRNELLKLGMHIVAPCPHESNCPMKDGDWCHFATRIQRSKLHKALKEGEASFEDEKFSYIVMSKIGTNRCASRILRHPIINKGMIRLTVCNKDDIKEIEIRKNHPDYKVIKKLKVGDSF